MLSRASVTTALVASLVLTLLPTVVVRVVAAPPELVQQAVTASSEDVWVDGEAEAGTLPSIPQDSAESPPAAGDKPGEESTPREPARLDSDSVRHRGLEAPVDLVEDAGQGAEHEPPEERENTVPVEPGKERRDPGDGPVRDREKDAQDRDRAPQGIRVWPMPANSYTFTQQFGCVPQLGNLYFPGEGCPADAPVIHTGIDLAAPEGTPFYAAASGWVTLADYDRPTADANTRIIIQHDGRNERYATDYLHWVASYVEEGDYVQAGDPIGEVGNVGFSTGPHLHFSVTDLDLGEHIDPLRWLPEEPGLEGYVSRRPAAQLRLPPGTTAGQPESADPNPPKPPVRQDVPENPPDEIDRRDRSERRDGRKSEERNGEKRGESAKGTSERSGKNRDRDASAAAPEAEGEAKKERERSRERDRTRERMRDGSRSEADDSGENGPPRGNRDESKREDRHRDRNATNGSSDDQGRKSDRDERDRSDDGGQSDSGDRGERQDERQNQDRGSGGQDKRAGGDGKNRADSTAPEGEVTGGEEKPESTPRDSGAEGDRGKRERREKT